MDVLVKAYLNDTLVHGNCYACAVGNLVCHGMGFIMNKGMNESNRFVHWVGQKYPGWPNGWGGVVSSDLDTDDDGNAIVEQEIDLSYFRGPAQAQIESTGYTVDQISQIEYAFESARITDGDVMFNGLMAVVDVLAEIHGVDLSLKEQAVGRFAEIHATKV